MVWNGHESVVVEQVQSPKQVKHTAAIGTRYDTYESASVKVFLAALPPGEVARLFERRLLVGTYDEHTLESYVAELDQVAEQGFADQRRPHLGRGGRASPPRFVTTVGSWWPPCCCRLRASGCRRPCWTSWPAASPTPLGEVSARLGGPQPEREGVPAPRVSAPRRCTASTRRPGTLSRSQQRARPRRGTTPCVLDGGEPDRGGPGCPCLARPGFPALQPSPDRHAVAQDGGVGEGRHLVAGVGPHLGGDMRGVPRDLLQRRDPHAVEALDALDELLERVRP